MSRKKLLKLGISILALNALGVATYHVAPDLYQIPTVHAEETPAEDEEIPDGAERNIALKFKRMLDDVEAFIADYKANPNDEDNKTGLEDSLAEATNYLPTAKKAMKSPEGQKGFVAYEARYNELKAKVEALLAGKTEQPAEPKVEHQEITTTEEIPYASRTENNADLAEGTRNVKQAGVKGTKTITWDITLTDGKETARTKKSEKVTKEPVEEIIEVGTKKTGVETKETVTYTDGKETGRVEKSNTITTPAVDEIVEVGTKKVASTTTNGDKKDPATTGNQAESTKKEETASQDKKALPSTGTAVSSLLSVIGLAFASLAAFVLRKKD